MRYKIRTDQDRTMEVVLEGSFSAAEDKSDADAGMTEILISTEGTAKVTNVSDGRDLDRFHHGFEVFLPVDSCPGWGSGGAGKGDYCNYEVFDVESPSLDAGETKEVDISTVERAGEVPVDKADQVLRDIMGEEGVLVSADRVFWNQELERLNPTCTFGGDGRWVTYYSESSSVDACSTEP